MTEVMAAIAGICGILLGWVLATLYQRKTYENELLELREKNATLTGRMEEKELTAGKMQEIAKSISRDVLIDNAKHINDRALSGISGMVDPVKVMIEQFQNTLRQDHEAQVKQNATLQLEIQNLAKLSGETSLAAENLTNAMTKNSKIRGNWGEMALDRILEVVGLEEGVQYEKQRKILSDEGKRYLPDVVINLPGNKKIIIDSKMSLVSWQEYCEAKTPEETDMALKRLAQAIESHVQDLHDKAYDEHEKDSLEMVFMFMPIEAVLPTVLKNKPELLEFATKRKIFLLSPTNLFSTLKLIQNLWNVENRNRNAEEIAAAAGRLYDKFVSFVTDLEDVEKHITKSHEAILGAKSKLISGPGSVTKSIQKLQKMGAKTRKALPAGYLPEADLSEDA